jgi:2-phosphosulfolactate phosphatase
MPTLDLYRLPQHAPPESLADATVIVVDLLRASTTICHALAAGAECVMPFAEIDETFAAAQAFGRENVILGGERHGKLIPGFDLGNSPAEYTRERVAGRRILFTTTNGARALDRVKTARRVLVGAAVNRAAVAHAALQNPHVVIACAGTDGIVADEDVLAAGAIVHALHEASQHWQVNDEACEALARWTLVHETARRTHFSLDDQMAYAIADSQGARNLLDIGHAADVALCSRLDLLAVVPQLNPTTNELRPA